MTEIFNHTLMITGFVFAMMVAIEYINVQTDGYWQKKLTGNKWKQYMVAAFLGIIPGCLGAFAVVAMYSHRVLTFGAVVTAMIATSGDEAFVMLAMIPEQALYITGALFLIGIFAGALTDFISGHKKAPQAMRCDGLNVHQLNRCRCFPRDQIIQQWRECSPFRATLAVGLLIFAIALISGQIGPSVWNWIKATLLGVVAFSLFIVITVPDHFLEEHLWRHVARQHIPRIFLWTFGTLFVMHILIDYLHIESAIQEGKWIVLFIACLVGLIPESGPHLVFLMLYAQGTIPVSLFLASSIVQDGHGMLPMLAHSRRAFLIVKLINFVIGIGIGAIGLVAGF
ncbi:MAG: hypothetical protein B6244_07110 [Candidatus Cloacimonetes bacterium 4572_55]|nr:MAG: hypothetical protein B6244_07110 [Candidatus Cloacimonetes bacterium 4572_55]